MIISETKRILKSCRNNSKKVFKNLNEPSKNLTKITTRTLKGSKEFRRRKFYSGLG